jgi:hypothetical protein
MQRPSRYQILLRRFIFLSYRLHPLIDISQIEDVSDYVRFEVVVNGS